VRLTAADTRLLAGEACERDPVSRAAREGGEGEGGRERERERERGTHTRTLPLTTRSLSLPSLFAQVLAAACGGPDALAARLAALQAFVEGRAAAAGAPVVTPSLRRAGRRGREGEGEEGGGDGGGGTAPGSALDELHAHLLARMCGVEVG
jgi:hypothetical protein